MKDLMIKRMTLKNSTKNCCGWVHDIVYLFKGQEKQVEEVGLCSDCFLDFLIENKAKITLPKVLK